MKTTIKHIFKSSEEFLQKEITLSGWVRTVRASKNFGFIELNDGSFFKSLQVVFEDNLENFAEISKLTAGSALTVKGVLVESQGKGQSVEVKATDIVIVGLADNDYPLQKKRHSFEFLRTIAHLRPRTNAFRAVFRVRSLIAHAIHSFFQERDFIYVHTPIITASDCEGAGEMFRVTTLNLTNIPKTDEGLIDYSQEFFAKETALTVSGQLAVENYAAAFRNVYTFGPTFRAENSNTQRHASEFWMVEPEMAFADLNDDMDVAEDMMKFVINYVLEHAPEEMTFFNSFVQKGLLEKLNHIVNSDFARMTYTEAITHLEKAKDSFDFMPSWGVDLQTEHERYLTEKVAKKPVFITDYPKDIKAFYMRLNDDGKTVAAVDLLVTGVGEIIGGSQREERLDLLEKRMKEMKLSLEEYKWYLDLRRYGTNPHAGFGLGFERLVMFITGMENIRDVIPFPRTPKHADF
ncbi:asparagine--tRNA ligase [bacterium]|nr:asparagine--tRNA ligase [bacterium]